MVCYPTLFSKIVDRYQIPRVWAQKGEVAREEKWDRLEIEREVKFKSWEAVALLIKWSPHRLVTTPSVRGTSLRQKDCQILAETRLRN